MIIILRSSYIVSSMSKASTWQFFVWDSKWIRLFKNNYFSQKKANLQLFEKGCTQNLKFSEVDEFQNEIIDYGSQCMFDLSFFGGGGF